MKVLKAIDKGFSKVSKAAMWFSAGLLFCIVIFIFVDVIMRYVFNHPITGQQEIAEMATVVIVYFGLPYATRIRSHVRVEPITGKFSVSVRSILYGILDLIATVFMAFLCVKVFQNGCKLTGEPGNASMLLRIPYFYIYFICSFGGLLGAIEFLLDGIRYFVEAGVAIKEKKAKKQETITEGGAE